MPTDPDTAPAYAGGEAAARALIERQIEALGELVDIGLKIARAIERQVDAAGAEAPSLAELNTAAIALARVARAVRQTIMLQSRLQEAQGAAAARAGELKARVNRIVRQAIEDETGEDGWGDDGAGEAERAERLCAEAAEGLERERWGDLMARPVSEILAEICRDLGLAPDWRGLRPEIAAAEAFAQGRKGGQGAEEDLPEYVDVCWIGDDGRPFPVARMRTTPNPPGLDPACDPAFRRDSS